MYKWLILITVLLNTSVFGQTTDSLIDLPPLETLIEYATKNSPMVKYYDKQVDLQAYEIKSARSNWLQYISIVSQYTYGNFDSYATVENTLAINSQEELRYNAGVRLSITLFDFLGRGRLLKKEKIRHAQSIFQKEEYLNELKGIVAEQYFNLKLQAELFSARFEIKQVLELQKQIAERDYRAGNIKISEFTTVVEVYTNSISEFEEVKAELSLRYFLLEQLLGVPINSIDK